MRRNSSLLTTAARAVADQSILDYGAGVAAHLAGDFSAHKEARLYPDPYNKAASLTIQAVAIAVYKKFKVSGNDMTFSEKIGDFTSSAVNFGTDTNWGWHPFGAGKFGAVVTAAFTVPATGDYTFAVTSDDGSYFFVDTTLVISNPGIHGPKTKSGTYLGLTAGTHTFTIKFWEDGQGRSGLDFALPSGCAYTDSAITTRTLADNTLRLGMDYNNNGTPGTKVIQVPAISTTSAYVGSSVPIIVTQPANQFVQMGQSASFSVVAISTTSLNYQWYFNDVAIPTALSSSLVIPSAAYSSAGNYKVTLTNSSGVTTSNTVILSIVT